MDATPAAAAWNDGQKSSDLIASRHPEALSSEPSHERNLLQP
jgi:hypothetical protein